MLLPARLKEPLATCWLSLQILRDYSQVSVIPLLPGTLNGSQALYRMVSVPMGLAALVQSSSFQNPF